MTLQTLLGLILLGIIAGLSSSLVGIGGGIIIVPVLVFVFGFDQKMAQGTSLLLLAMPVALAGAVTYYKAGNVDVKTALVLAACFVVGGFLGGKLANKLDTFYVKKIFAIFMIIMAVKYLFFDKPSAPKATLKNLIAKILLIMLKNLILSKCQSHVTHDTIPSPPFPTFSP